MVTPNTSSAVVRDVDTDGPYVDWPAIFGGAVLAAGVSFVLWTFGSGLGLSMVSAEPGEGVSLGWLTIAAGIWFIWVAVSSFSAGGYLAGRLRRRIGDASEDEVETRDGAHGVLVWAVGTLISIMLALSGIGGLLGATASVTGAAADTAVSVVEDQVDYFADRILRRTTGGGISAETREEAMTILARSVARGELAQDDRAHLVRMASEETDTPPEEVEARVNTVLSELDAAREEAMETAEQARVVGLIASFVIAATLLVSAAAAYFAAAYGGQHRDQNVGFRQFGRPRRV
ncbi:MAG: hypothetical protein WD270_00070 [Acetobacterales bacterium]